MEYNRDPVYSSVAPGLSKCRVDLESFRALNFYVEPRIRCDLDIGSTGSAAVLLCPHGLETVIATEPDELELAAFALRLTVHHVTSSGHLPVGASARLGVSRRRRDHRPNRQFAVQATAPRPARAAPAASVVSRIPAAVDP